MVNRRKPPHALKGSALVRTRLANNVCAFWIVLRIKHSLFQEIFFLYLAVMIMAVGHLGRMMHTLSAWRKKSPSHPASWKSRIFLWAFGRLSLMSLRMDYRHLVGDLKVWLLYPGSNNVLILEFIIPDNPHFTGITECYKYDIVDKRWFCSGHKNLPQAYNGRFHKIFFINW